MANPSLSEGSMLVSGGASEGLSGVAVATCRTTEATKVLAVPISIWQSWWDQSSTLAEWLESHPQRGICT